MGLALLDPRFDDERFTATIDAHGTGLAAYLCDAMAVHARERLS